MTAGRASTQETIKQTGAAASPSLTGNTSGGTGTTGVKFDAASHISGRAQKELAPFNAVWLWFTGITTFFLSFISDIFGPATGPILGWLVVCLLIIAIPLVLLLIGRESDQEPRPVGWSACIRVGSGRAWKHKRYSVLLLAVAVFAAYACYVKAKSEGTGPMRELLLSTVTIEEVTRRTEKAVSRVEANTDILLDKTTRIEAEITKPLTPKELLTKKGVQWNATTFQQGLYDGDAQLIQEMIDAGWDPLSQAPAGFAGSSVTNFFHEGIGNSRTVEVIKVLSKHMNLTEPVLRWNNTSASRPSTVAVEACNLSMVWALKEAGINVRVLDKPDINPATGQPLPNIVETTKKRGPELWRAFRCPIDARDGILQMIQPAVYR